MITEKHILSGTEEELLEYFKQKYNLIEKEVKDVASILEQHEKNSETTSSTQIGGAAVGNKVTTGMKNLFGGTSWSN
jgi:hypothetical protein